VDRNTNLQSIAILHDVIQQPIEYFPLRFYNKFQYVCEKYFSTKVPKMY